MLQKLQPENGEPWVVGGRACGRWRLDRRLEAEKFRRIKV